MARGGRPGDPSPAPSPPGERATSWRGSGCAQDIVLQLRAEGSLMPLPSSLAPVERAVMEDGLRVLNTFLHVPDVGLASHVRSSSAPATARGHGPTAAAEGSGTGAMASRAGGGASPVGPTWGSILHSTGRCRPCLFSERGCKSGELCQFCHICTPAERRAAEKKQQYFSWRSLRKATAAARVRARGS